MALKTKKQLKEEAEKKADKLEEEKVEKKAEKKAEKLEEEKVGLSSAPALTPTEELKSLGLLGGKQITSIIPNKTFIGGKAYHQYVCADQTTYLLNDHDVETQVKK